MPDHYAVIFTHLLPKIFLLFFRFEFAQESKKFQKMDKNDVQNRHRRKTFGKIRALLGVLRNFLGTHFERPYMQWLIIQLNYFQQFIVFIIFNTVNLYLNFLHKTNQFVHHVHALSIWIKSYEHPFSTVYHVEIIIP